MQTNMKFTQSNVIKKLIELITFLIVAGVLIYWMPIASQMIVDRVHQIKQSEQHNPYLDPALYSALSIELHKADPDYNNPHYYGRIVPLGNVITVQVINDDGERELIESTFDYLRNGSKG